MNDDKEFINCINEISKFYKLSEEYKEGKKIIFLKENLKNKRYIFLIKKFFNSFFRRKDKKKDDIKLNLPIGIKVSANTNKKIAVYTCITGNYDYVEEPMIIEENCDYFLYTNNQNIKSTVWKIKQIPENIIKLNDNVLINRYIKMHPDELFENSYDYSIYIDGNVKILSRISYMIEKINSKTGLAIYRHSNNKNTYQEIDNCIFLKKGNKKSLKQFYKKLKKEKFPEDFETFQCNILVNDLKNENSKNIFNEWFKYFSSTDSCRRDQIYLPYVLWKLGYKSIDIGYLGNNINSNYSIIVNKHKV